MITLRFALAAVLTTVVVGGCLTLLVSPPARLLSDSVLMPTLPNLRVNDTTISKQIDHALSAEEKAAVAYQKAADAILRRAPNARASAITNEQPIRPPIPLPKRRPILPP
jgi:hypothetical protein